MLPRCAIKCLIPIASYTTISSLRVRTPPVAATPLADLKMPTPLIDPERLERLGCGTGQPAQRGRRKPLVWKRRKPWFDHQWSLDLQRERKGPSTPHFPDGVPFTQIRSFQSFAGRSWKLNAGRRRKIRLSLKRGRRKLL
eukprot:gene13352-9184_t